MNWYGGNIAEAVAMSKTKNAIFVVYIEGSDEVTQKLTMIINEPKIKSKLESDDFVAIKISSNSQAYMQFAKIYQVVPVPSIFFIGNAGTPLEIGTGIIASSDELEKKIESVLTQAGKGVGSNSAVNTTAAFIASEQAAMQAEATSIPIPAAGENSVIPKTEAESKITCDGDACQRNVEPTNTPAVAPSEETVAKQLPTPRSEEVNANFEETRRLLEQKRRERIAMEKEQELRRRREGAEGAKQALSWQKDQELKELKDNLRRERLEEQAARDRIRAQIAGDRAERAQKFAQEKTKGATAEATPGASTPPQVAVSGNTRLQFRLPTGESKSQTFNCQDTFSVVHSFVQTDVIPGTGIRDFIMATSYPKREFSLEHGTQTLLDLGLFPNAVIMVIPKESGISPGRVIARSGGIVNMFSSVFWTLLTPVFAIYGYFRSKFGGRAVGGSPKRANEEQQTQTEAPKKRRNLDSFMSGPSTSQQPPAANTYTPFGGAENDASDSRPRRRYIGSSNIHRLSDKRKDSDDENATWNGNSTQQQ